MSGSSNSTISLYFHIPLCRKKCGYCHFYVIPDKPIFKEKLLEGYLWEWEQAIPLLKNKSIHTVYFGGGTPYLLGPEPIQHLLSKIDSSIEITIEANPEDVDLDSLIAYKKAGINRLSLGVQSFNENELVSLTRTHSAEKAKEAVFLAHEAGFTNISIDLMYDVPQQTLNSWLNSIKTALTLPITHLSFYNLTLEPQTVFYKYKEAIQKQIPKEEESAEMYIQAAALLEEAGLKQYEISAFAKEGYIAQHNTGYWTGRPFLGFGPSAFSYWEGKRFRNAPHLNRWHRALEKQDSPVDFEETLDTEAKQKELLSVRLRMLDGVDLKEWQLNDETLTVLEKLCEEGFLEKKGKRITLTKRGILFYDSVALEIV